MTDPSDMGDDQDIAPPPGSVEALIESLLVVLNSDQQLLVDLVMGGFLETGQWPVFDYIEGELDEQGIDAWSVLESLPTIHSTRYSAARWSRAPNVKPAPDLTVSLTVLGLYHQTVWGAEGAAFVSAFLLLVRRLAEWRHSLPRSPAAPRDLAFRSTSEISKGFGQGIPHMPSVPASVLFELMHGEPVLYPENPTSLDPTDGSWQRGVSRQILRFGQISDMRDYISETVRMNWRPVHVVESATPSPLGLVAAIDYLDAVWRLVTPKAGHLFQLPSAQRTAQLAFPAYTQNDFDSRLAGLAEILRSVQVAESSGKKHRDKPLQPLASHIADKSPGSEPRVRAAVATLHLVIDVRDSGQHTGAASKGVTAMADLGVGYPPSSWQDAWEVISDRATSAFDAIREELATLS